MIVTHAMDLHCSETAVVDLCLETHQIELHQLLWPQVQQLQKLWLCDVVNLRSKYGVRVKLVVRSQRKPETA